MNIPAVLAFLFSVIFLAPPAAADFPVVTPDPEIPARLVVDAGALPEGDITLPSPFANITSARGADVRLDIGFNADATLIRLLAPADGPRPETIILDTAENSVQFPDGTIVFSALDATVRGDSAKLESHPGNHRIGFWSNPADTVGWPYQPTRYGSYRAELTYALDSGTSEIEVTFAGATLKATLPPTGSWYRYRTLDLGSLYAAEAKTEMVVRPLGMTGAAVMNLKAITLRPAPEGTPVVQKGAGTIELDASQATVLGVTLRFEPRPEKRCLGYWSNPRDRAAWELTATTPGNYTVEITQGCGGGNAGSTVDVVLGDQILPFTVEDTGGFQTWKTREIGTLAIAKPGLHRLEIRPRDKKAAAVMDIRRVRLIPQ